MTKPPTVRNKPGPPCSVCVHPQRAEIDYGLAVDDLSCRAAAAQYGLHYSSVWNHRSRHLAAELAAKASERAAELGIERRAIVDELYDELEWVRLFKSTVVDASEAMRVAGEVRQHLALIGKGTGELRDRVDVTAAVDAAVSGPGMPGHLVMERIVNVLEPWPEARHAVSLAMLDLATQSRLPGEWTTTSHDHDDDDEPEADAEPVPEPVE